MPDDDDILKKIQEASERYQPAYDDASWADMQRLLDEHLPQKKNKRRVIYLILLALIPLAGIYTVFKLKNPGTALSSVSTASNASKLKVPEVNQLKQPLVAAQKGNTPTQQNNATNNLAPKKSAIKIAGTGTSYTLKPSFSKHIPLVKNQNTNTSVSVAENSPENSGQEKTPDAGRIADAGTSLPANTNTTADVLNTDKHDSLQTSKTLNVTGKSNKEDTSKNKVTVSSRKKDNNHFKHYWIISATSGPDVSAVKLDNTGKITLQYGIQLGYAVSQRFTLRTGFFISKKIYSVGADDYHGQGSYYNNYLQSVNANCKVYEIPLLATYNFAGTKKGRWFVSAGLSSYFMKKESYEYLYKYPSGPVYTNNYSVSNKNKHYFSIIDFSAGYERTISKRLSLSAEPYLKLPATGIGVGKIKLSSAGVMFSINVKPF